MQSLLQPKTPTNPAWRAFQVAIKTDYPTIGFYHDRLGLFVISAVEVAEQEIGPEYHVSISKTKGPYSHPSRCSLAEARLVCKQFGMEGAKEDNHSSIIRSYWMPVNEKLIGIECECKDQEAVIKEGDFEWRPLTGANAERAVRLEGGSRMEHTTSDRIDS